MSYNATVSFDPLECGVFSVAAMDRVKNIVEEGVGIGVNLDEELYVNYKEEARRVDDSGMVHFGLTDRPGAEMAVCLIDGMDYADGAEIGLPLRSSERILRVALALMVFVSECKPGVFYLFLSQGDECDDVISLTLSELIRELTGTFDESSRLMYSIVEVSL